MLGVQPHHTCYATDDLERAATTMARLLGAGPFFLMPNAPFDELVFADGEACTWEHELAFGSLGTQVIELTRNLAVEPPRLREAFAGRPVNHIGYSAPDLEQASDRLVAAGATRFLRGSSGPVRMIYHQVPGLGCIELLQADPVHERLAAALVARAEGWDGTKPLREGLPF